jgi:hypothetical protein
MELIHTVFNQLEDDIHQKLKVLEKQVVFILAANQHVTPSDDFLVIKKVMESMAARLSEMEERMRSLEAKPVLVSPPVTSAGLEGLLMKPIALPSPALSARSENQIVVPNIFQRQLVIDEQDEAEPDDEAVCGVVAEETGGIDEQEEEEEELEEVVEEVVEEQEEEEQEEEEQEEEEQEEEQEEEEAETIELEEFIWKGKTYFKTPDHMVYRANDEGDVEDEAFAKYDPKTNTLKRI